MCLEECRAQIDSIDNKLLVLMNQRASLVSKLAATKQRQGVAIRDRHREREVLSRMTASNSGPMDERAVKAIFGKIIFESRRMAGGLAGTSPKKP
jgi:chorismate mutase